jgi:hypothetical protein
MELDFSLPPQQTFTIRGRVIDEVTNTPPPSIGVTMNYAAITGGGGALTVTVPYDASSGTFEIRNFPAGKYFMTVASNGRLGGTSLNVVNNIDGIAIVLSSSMSLTGRISMDGRPGLPISEPVRVQLKNMASGMTSSDIANTEGSFRFDNVVAGEYRVSISSDGNTIYYMKSARFGRNDALAAPFVITDSSQLAPLDIVISPNVARVEGVLLDEQFRPVANVQAVLIPQSDRDRTDLFRAVLTNPNGRFIIDNVVPGDYKLFAWDALEPNGYFDLDFVKKYEQQGKVLHVAEGSVSNIDLKVIALER